jgi:hypothetical protein
MAKAPTTTELRQAYDILERLSASGEMPRVGAIHLWETQRDLAHVILRRETRD